MVEVKNLKSGETIKLGEFDCLDEIPVSIYEDTAVWIVDGNIYIYDLNKEQVVNISQNLYCCDILLYKNHIFTNKLVENDHYNYVYDVVQLDLEFNEKVILEKSFYENSFARSEDYIIWDKYFYDINNENVYTALGDEYETINNKIIDGYILDVDNDYEELEQNKNYEIYPLKSADNSYNIINRSEENEARILLSGEIDLYSKNSNKIENYFDGFDNDNGIKAYEYVYSMKLNKDKIGILIQNSNRNNSKLYIYDIDTNKINEINLDIDDKIQSVVFNDEKIVALSFDSSLYVCGINTGYILDKYAEDSDGEIYMDIYGVNNDEIVVSNDCGEYYLLNYNFEKVKIFSDYEEMIDYYNKNR